MPPAQARCMAVSFLHRGLFFTISFPTAVYNLPTNRYNEGVSFFTEHGRRRGFGLFGYVSSDPIGFPLGFSQGLPAGIQAADHRRGDDAFPFGGRLLAGADLHRGSDEPAGGPRGAGSFTKAPPRGRPPGSTSSTSKTASGSRSARRPRRTAPPTSTLSPLSS